MSMSWLGLLLLAALAIGPMAAAVGGFLLLVWFIWWIQRGGNDPPE
jgi:hypothetical protein